MSEKYIGAHGTSRSSADNIQANGFKMPYFFWPGQSRFGPGLYMYKGNEAGIGNACRWASFKCQNEAVCVLIPTFSYDMDLCLQWNKALEDIAMEQAAAGAGIKEGAPIPEEEINQAREHMIEYMSQTKGITYQAVFAIFCHGKNEMDPGLDGCCLFDLSLLDNPPYKEIPCA